MPSCVFFFKEMKILIVRLYLFADTITPLSQALAVTPTNTKGLYRRSLAYYHTFNYVQALADLNKVPTSEIVKGLARMWLISVSSPF